MNGGNGEGILKGERGLRGIELVQPSQTGSGDERWKKRRLGDGW